MKYKERYVCALHERVANALVQSTHVSLVVFSHFVVAFGFWQSNPAKEQESGQMMVIAARTKKGAYCPLSSLQLLSSIIIFLVPRSYLYPINTFCLLMRLTSTVYTVSFFPCLD